MKLLTLNLHCFEEPHIEKNQQLIVQTIIEEGIDIICFQEGAQSVDAKMVYENIREDNYADKIKELLFFKGLNYQLFYRISNQAFGRFDEGLAILSRIPFKSFNSFYVSKAMDYDNFLSRMIVKGSFVIKGKKLNVFSSHFGWSDGNEFFEEQFKNVMLHFDEDSINIVAGDHNMVETSKEYRFVKRHGMIDLYAMDDKKRLHDETFKGDEFHPGSRIDYIFSDKPVTILNRKILFNTEEDRVSDHFGVLLDIDL